MAMCMGKRKRRKSKKSRTLVIRIKR